MYPTINLQPGSTNKQAVQQLQQWLVANGYMTQAQVNTGPGIYGPQTTVAVQKAQEALGVDNSSGPGYWGPKTIAAVSGGGTSSNPTQTFTTPSGLKVDINGNPVSTPITPENTQRLAEEAKKLAEANPIISAFQQQGSTFEDLQNAVNTGNFSQIKNSNGQPFTLQEQQDALKQGEADNKAYFDELQQKETQDAEASLKQKNLDYQNYLVTQGAKFQADKTNLDQTSANNGVLFSGGRAQKEQQLKDTYSTADEYKRASVGSDIGNTARDYGYAYGDKAANGLSQYYSLGSNSYNPNVATGGVTSGGLSSVYNAGNSNFNGTRVGERNTANKLSATKLLWNKANKLVGSGYQNQY